MIRKIKAQSPDPYLGKTQGDTEFARLAHLNYVIDAINNSNKSITVNGNTSVTNLTIGPVASETYNNGSLDITIDPYPGYKVYRAKIAIQSEVFYIDVLENTLNVSLGQPSWITITDDNGPIYKLNKNKWNKTHIKITPGYDITDFPTINERSLLIERAVEGDFDIIFRPIKKDGTTGAITIEDLNNYTNVPEEFISYVYVEILEYSSATPYYGSGLSVALGDSNLED
jgi:hypothetical protein